MYLLNGLGQRSRSMNDKKSYGNKYICFYIKGHVKKKSGSDTPVARKQHYLLLQNIVDDFFEDIYQNAIFMILLNNKVGYIQTRNQ